MSPFRRKALYVALCPDRVGIVLFEGRAWRKNWITAVLNVERTSNKLGVWSPFDSFSEWLDGADACGADMHITIADEFVRYSTMPWSDDVRRRIDQQALAQACIASLYGERVDDWEIQFDYRSEGKPGLICAMERDFIQSLLEISSRHKLNLKSLQPAFIRVVNGCHAQIPDVDGLVAVLSESSWVCCGRRDDAWTQIGLQSIHSPVEIDMLSKLVRREMALHGLPGLSSVTLFCHTGNLRRVAEKVAYAKVMLLSDRNNDGSRSPEGYPVELALCGSL